MDEIERERSSEGRQKLEPYFVYFAAAHQAKPKKTVEAEPVLLLAPNAEMAVRKARFKIRGIKRDQVLDVRIAEKEEFRTKAKERLEEGQNLPRDVIEYAGLQELAERLKK